MSTPYGPIASIWGHRACSRGMDMAPVVQGAQNVCSMGCWWCDNCHMGLVLALPGCEGEGSACVGRKQDMESWTTCCSHQNRCSIHDTCQG